MEKIINKIHQLVIDNELMDALYELKSIAQSLDDQNQIVLLIAQLTEWRRDDRADIEEERSMAKRLNRIRLGVLELLNSIATVAKPSHHEEVSQDEMDLEDLMEALEISSQTFVAQSRIRNQLLKSLKGRFTDMKQRNVINIFSHYHAKMNDYELRLHASIRGYTQHVIAKYNDQALHILQNNPNLKQEIERLKNLERHLIIWKSKYESTFVNDETIALVYVGVEEQVPFPKGIEREIEDYLLED